MGSNDKWSKFWRQGNQRQGIQRQGIIIHSLLKQENFSMRQLIHQEIIYLIHWSIDPLGNILKMLIEYTLEPKKKRLLEVPKVWFDCKKKLWNLIKKEIWSNKSALVVKRNSFVSQFYEVCKNIFSAGGSK